MNHPLKAIAAASLALVLASGAAAAVATTGPDVPIRVSESIGSGTTNPQGTAHGQTRVSLPRDPDASVPEKNPTTPTTPTTTPTPTTSTTAPDPIDDLVVEPGEPDPFRGPLGSLGLSGAVPAGLRLTDFPGASHGGGSVDQEGPGSFSAGPGCAYQCTVSGLAYADGTSVDLVVKTSVQADLWISVIADSDDDGDYGDHPDFKHFDESAGKVTTQTWTLHDLEPGEIYYVMVTATDQYGDISYAWGNFTMPA